jgi:hypothetical protein
MPLPSTAAPRRSHRTVVLGIVAGVLLSGCSSFGYRPVQPYEREALASPLMALSRDPISDKHLQHVFETREGARGATGNTGGGCGCN